MSMSVKAPVIAAKGQVKTHTRTDLPIHSLRKVADVAPGLITVYNIRTGRYTYVNDALRRILGYEPSSFIENGVDFAVSLVHRSDIARIARENSAAVAMANALPAGAKDGEPIVNFKYRMRHAKTGKWVWLHTDGSVFSRGTDGKVESVLNVSVDITAAKAAERKLRQLNEQLIALNNAKDEFISIASHQLRTPATAVKLYASMLLHNYAGPLNPEQEEYASVIQKNNEQLIKIVNDLLCVARLDSGTLPLDKAECNVVDLVADVVRQQTKSFELRNQQLLFSAAAKEARAQLDSELVRMAVENIIDNAGKYSPAGETVHVHVLEDDRHLLLHITDNGMGIAKKDHKKLFQKFSRLDHSHAYAIDGTGLGLYWANKVIAMHGGKIEFVSEVNKGSTFTIRLPLA